MYSHFAMNCEESSFLDYALDILKYFQEGLLSQPDCRNYFGYFFFIVKLLPLHYALQLCL